MLSNSASQLRQLHPDASDEALDFHERIVEVMILADAPTGHILGFASLKPKGPDWLPIQVCLHDRALDIYGTVEVNGEQRCTQCCASYRLWVPPPHDGLLRDPDALFNVEFALGELLARLRREEREQPNERLREIIGQHEATIDALSDLRTVSNAHWHPAPKRKPKLRRDV